MTLQSRPDLTDIHKGDWVDRHLTPMLRPYARLARLDRPVGIWLTLFPCLAALFQAAQGLPNLANLVVFTLGAFLMRSAGSTINDIADRNFDGHVERTRFRPLANNEISLPSAFIFLAVQLVLAASLLIFLTPYTRILAMCVVPLVIIYPFCKRFAAWLGLTPLNKSSGGKERLGHISKMGDQYIRRLLVLGMTSRIRSIRSEPETLDPWFADILSRKPSRVAAVVMANKSRSDSAFAPP